MSAASSVDLAGRRALVVEDQFLIAMDMEQMLRSMGAGAIDLATTVSDALASLDRAKPDLVLLDLKLQSETTHPVVDVLRKRGVPFVLMTGYDASAIPAPFRDLPLVRKPLDIGMLAAAIRTLKL